MGQRFVQLDSSYSANEDGSGVLHVSQLPPNPAILAPGPACAYHKKSMLTLQTLI